MNRAAPWLLCSALALITLLIYWPARHHDYVIYDDPDYVVANTHVRDGLTWAGVQWAATSFEHSNWHPATWWSHMLDYELFGLNAGGHHAVNVLLHAANAILLLLLLRLATGALWQSALVAALFAWHPLHVESVAWIAERKDVLSGFFFMLTLLMYVRYLQKRAGNSGKSGLAEYAAALGFFALGLMSKPMLVTVPLVLLLLALLWPRFPGIGFRLSTVGLQLMPFFLLSAVSCVLTFMAQRSGESVAPLDSYPLSLRLGNAPVAYVMYLAKTLVPLNLSVIYPLPRELPWGRVLASVAVLVVITGLAWRARRHRPYLFAGWLWFLIMLLPVIGLVQVGFQSMADRYTYLPLIGIFVGAVFGAGDLLARLRTGPAVCAGLTAIVLLACLAGTALQLRFWRNSKTLFEHALAVTANNSIAENNLGVVLFQAGKVAEAIPHFQRAVAINPDFAVAGNNLGAALREAGRIEEAIRELRRALDLKPDYPAAHNSLAKALIQQGNIREAMPHLEAVLNLQPDHVEVLNNLAWIYATAPEDSLRDGTRAVELAQRADRLARGSHPGIAGTLAAAYAETGSFEDAKTAVERAMQLAGTGGTIAQTNLLRSQLQSYQNALPWRDDHLGSSQPGMHGGSRQRAPGFGDPPPP